ncbi:MAG TPA: PadR family transcriptional regulator [Trebonia sp.]|nr:PadR family transcriptional regulator [Trebonia sp.]
MPQSRRILTLTPLGIAILSLLARQPMHPYEMRHVIRVREIDRVMKVTHGTLYSTVDRLAEAGLIQPVQTSREGRRPERTVYEITDPGRDQLLDALRAELMRTTPDYPRLAMALTFASLLEPREVGELLERRCVDVEGQLSNFQAALDAAFKRSSQQLTRVNLIEVEYQIALLRAERDWLRAVVDDITDGRFSWQAPLAETGQASRADRADRAEGADGHE